MGYSAANHDVCFSRPSTRPAEAARQAGASPMAPPGKAIEDQRRKGNDGRAQATNPGPERRGSIDVSRLSERSMVPKYDAGIDAGYNSRLQSIGAGPSLADHSFGHRQDEARSSELRQRSWLPNGSVDASRLSENSIVPRYNEAGYDPRWQMRGAMPVPSASRSPFAGTQAVESIHALRPFRDMRPRRLTDVVPLDVHEDDDAWGRYFRGRRLPEP